VIVASEACAKEMGEVPPACSRSLVANADALGPVAAKFVQRAFGSFQFAGITLTPPTENVQRRELAAGGAKEVQLIEVGPAHTRGGRARARALRSHRVHRRHRIRARAPDHLGGPDRELGCRACDRILAMDVDTVVPGHGPICGLAVVGELRGYLLHIDPRRSAARAGLSCEEAARAIALDDYRRGATRADRGEPVRALPRARRFGSRAEPAGAVHLDGAARRTIAGASSARARPALELLELAGCALERRAIPLRVIRGRLELDWRNASSARRSGGGAHGVVGQQELPEVFVVRGGGREHARVGVAIRFRVRVE